MSELSEKKGNWEITLNKPEGGTFDFELKPMDIDVYYAMNKLIRAGKTFESYIMALKTLKANEANDDPDVLKNDPSYLPCLMALDSIFAEMLQPVEYSIKKN